MDGGTGSRGPQREGSGIPLNEYPRPQFMRPDWLNLNGIWEYDTAPADRVPEELTGKILVPFSPEAALSEAARKPGIGDKSWYARSFTLPEGFFRGRLLLNFGAVDQICQVFINGRLAGEHEGGYTPFTLDITPYILPEAENDTGS